MNVSIKLDAPGLADGYYRVRAKGCMTTFLHWARGGVTQLEVWENGMELKGFLLHGGRKIARGYYRWA